MQVIINKKSWHYRWFKFIGNKMVEKGKWEAPKSVCGYFWGFIFTNLFMVVMSLAAIAIGGFLIYILTAPVWYQFFPEFGPNGDGKEIAYIGGAFNILLLCLFLVIVISNKDSGFIAVIKAYLWGVKNKVCPMITYKEDK